MTDVITSAANPRIKRIKGLDLKKHRNESGQFLAEGVKIVLDALERGWKPAALVYAHDSAEDPLIAKAIQLARAQDAELLPVSDGALKKLSHRDNPQSLLGVFYQRWAGVEAIKMLKGLWVGLDRVRDPGNLGTIIRTVDAVGAKGVVLIGDCTDPYAQEAVRAAMGSTFAVKLARATEDEFMTWADLWDGQIVGTHLKATQDYRAIDWQDQCLILMGNEQAGLTPRLGTSCHDLVKIPMRGGADSLNLAVSTGIVLYQAGNALAGA